MEKQLIFDFYETLQDLFINGKIDIDTLNLILNKFGKIKEIVKKVIDNK